MSYTLKSGAVVDLCDVFINDGSEPLQLRCEHDKSAVMPLKTSIDGTRKHLTDDERREIAAEMVRRWTAWGDGK